MKFLLTLLFFWNASVRAASEVPVLTVADSVNPGTGDYIVAAIDEAERNQAPFLILVLDTPGGLLTTTRQIVQKMLNTFVPIVVYVGPQGAHAGSAGALITLAADVAAMAPATNMGAAHPVTPGGGNTDKTLAAKLANDTAAFAESIAKTRGRNTEWAIKSVKDSASVTSDEALKQGIIDVIATDVAELKTKLVGFRLRTPKGKITQLPEAAATYRDCPMGIKHRLISFFANPDLAYMILSFGALCLWVELTHPGLIFPGVLGMLCLIVSLVSFQLLPISYGALALILLGLGFIIAELFLPTYGLLGVAGITAFVFGSLFLMDTSSPEFQISLRLILPTAACLAATAGALAYLVLKAQRTRHLSGLEALVGQFGEAREVVTENSGKVMVQGELWNALSADGAEIPKGAVVVVKQVRRMQLLVSQKTPA